MEFVDRFKAAIDLEQKVDLNQTNAYLETYSVKKLAKLGLAVVNLIIDNIRTGLGGKTVIELVIDTAIGKDIEIGSIKTGDIVKIDKMGEDSEELNGVVTKISTSSISVSIDEDKDEDNVLNMYNNTGSDNKIYIVKLTNSITYKRMMITMNKLNELKDKPDIMKVLLGEMPYFQYNSKIKVKEFFNDNLNGSQKEAIEFCLNSPVSIIHGPPGTGKTFTVIELIKQLVSVNERVLVCGPSNISVDTILERLSSNFGGKKKNNGKLIRIGHPARLLDKNLQHSLDILSKNTSSDILSDIDNDIRTTLKNIKKCKRRSERKGLYQELKQLKKELRVREKKVIKDLLLGSQVVLSTLHGAGSRELLSVYDQGPKFFDTIIIDEVSQSLEPQCWIPIIHHLGIKRIIIAGDNMQLPPTIKTLDEDINIDFKTTANLEKTLFDRLMEIGGEQYKKLLDTQYRMNEEIMEFPSSELYEGKLKAFEATKDISLHDLVDDEVDDDDFSKCIWIDTQGGEYPEQANEDDNSKYNEHEIVLVKKHLEKLINLGIKPQDIGIISPYNAQVSLLKKQLEGIEISTVDGFQGREKEVIIITLVRSNDNGEIGFLKDRRRLNVAMTRPKRQLCVIGDLELMNRSTEFLNHWSQYVEDKFDLRYPDMEY
ncbi:DNA polymerase alpha-associated DNA helicase A [[Candida] jaroonii]|uniref:DNA polymerase alpha-associated DNA helicase A n=1 Tax=[Candida] jaroonii TaxID=467808 RepID=A0ACA9Y740_9ASCO|nr:DNA polymerase alpha-associated DNA helicase A [[Candida] jaroonii]